MTWEPSAAGGCSFIGSMSIMECGRSTLAIVLDGMAEVHEFAQLQDERLGRESAEATGRAVLERIASELALRSWDMASPRRRIAAAGNQRFMRSASPMLHAARAKSARMG